MGDDVNILSFTVVIVFGIVGNILVILSILGEKQNMLNSNCYFLVRHLTMCDLAALILHIFYSVEFYSLKPSLLDHFLMITCHVHAITSAFQFAGVGMMLIISLLRHRATVHSLKPAISRRKLKVVCGLVYLVGFIVGGETYLPRCFIKSADMLAAHLKFNRASGMFSSFFVPTIFMAVVYYKICRSLMKQNN